MKSLLFIALICCSLSALPQTSRAVLTQQSIVKDSAGNVYPFNVWSPLISDPAIQIRAVDDKNRNSDFLIVRLTEEQAKQRLEKMPKPKESEFFITGRDFAPFKATDINNNKINIKDEKGKILVINFWFINCPPCRSEIPELNRIVEDFKGNDRVKFIGIALDSKGDLKQFLKVLDFKYNIVDNGSFIAGRYGIRAYPTHVIVDPEGKIQFHTTGLALNTAYWLRKSINELLSAPVATSQAVSP